MPSSPTPFLPARTCANTTCAQPFQPSYEFHKYCSVRCGTQQWRRDAKAKDRARRLGISIEEATEPVPAPLPKIEVNDLTDLEAVERAKALYVENLRKAGRLP